MKSLKELPVGFAEIAKVDLQKNKKQALLVNGVSVVLIAVMAAFMWIFVPITDTFKFDASSLTESLIKVIVLCVGYIAYIILHELTHAVAMKICGTEKVKFGFTGLYAFAGSDDYYNKKAYIFIALAPVVVWGIVLLIANLLVPYDWIWIVYFIQIGNVSGAAGDFYVTFRFNKMPSDILVRDTGVNMSVYSKSE